MTELSMWIDEKQLKQHDAAIILGVSRPRVSDVVHKKTVKFTIDSLVDMLARTGKHVELSVR
jgi:predicted XRE-type DNA-binding protein